MWVIISPILLAGRLSLLIEIIRWQLSFGHNGQAFVTFLGLYPFEILLVLLLKPYMKIGEGPIPIVLLWLLRLIKILCIHSTKKNKGIQLLLTLCPGIIVTASAYRAENCYCLQIRPMHGKCLVHHRFILGPKWVGTWSSFKPTSKNTKLGLRFFLKNYLVYFINQ